MKPTAPAVAPTTTTPSKGSKAAFNRRLKDARIGDLQAQYDVGVMLASGSGGADQDVTKAHKWLKSAAQRGHGGAQYLLGVAHASGVGVARDEWEAFQWFFRSREQNNPRAAHQLSRLLEKHGAKLQVKSCLEAAQAGVAKAQWELGLHALDEGNREQSVQGLEWLHRAAEQGLAEAQYELGRRLSKAAESPAEQTQARELLKKAAQQGMASAHVALDELDQSTSHEALKRSGKHKLQKDLEEGLTTFAQTGSAENLYHLAVMYERGLSVPQRFDKALAWYESAAQKGNALAQIKMAQTLGGQDPPGAARWYAQAAAQGNADAQYAYARCLETGNGVGKDPLAAHLWLTRAAEQNQPDALNTLGEVLQASQPELALACTMKAAKAGHATAQMRLAMAYRHGHQTEEDPALAVQWMQLSAEAGHPEAQCELANWYAQGWGLAQDVARAAAWYAKAVDHASGLTLARAQWALGNLLAKGGTGLTRDVRRATLLCRKAANAGYAPAQATMGLLMSMAGQHGKALRWWDKAADQGDPEAQYNLGMARLRGQGALQDAEQAFIWVMHAAQAGVPAAQQRIGFAYATGLGVPQDVVEAMKWFLLAAERGNEDARANLQHARSVLNPAQVAEATRRADNWVPKRKTSEETQRISALDSRRAA